MDMEKLRRKTLFGRPATGPRPGVGKVVALTILLGVMALPAAAGPLRIGTVAWMGWSPLHVAREKGFWKDRGLDVEVITYDDPIVILGAIKAKRIHLAMDMAGSLVGIHMNGEPVVAIAETDWSHGGDKIVVRKGRRLEDHLGGVIGVFLDQPSCLFFLGKYLAQRHLALSRFRIVEINPRDLSAQFAAGRIPVMVNYEPWVHEAVVEGDGRVLATSADYEGCIPECMWGYRDTIEEIGPESIHIILEGWIRAVRWMGAAGHRDALFEILKRTTFRNEPGLGHGDLSRMMAEVVIHDPSGLMARNRTGGGLYGYLAELKTFLSSNDLLKKDFTPESIFDNRYIMHVLHTAGN